MPDQPEPACLVLADISGYTSYLAGVELDHAQDVFDGSVLRDTIEHKACTPASAWRNLTARS